MTRIHVRVNAVTEVEDVPRSAFGGLQDFPDAAFQDRQLSIQRDGVEVSLNRSIMPHHLPCIRQIDAPIDSDDLSSGSRLIGNQRGIPGQEVDDGNIIRNLLDELPRVWLHEIPKSAGVRQPAQLSKIWTAWQPASICARR